MDLVGIPFELRPDVPAEGISATEHGLAHSERVEKRLLELAEAAGHPMVLPDHVPNTHRAIVLAEYARDRGDDVFWRVHQAVFDAYYGQGLDISATGVLLAIASAEGFDSAEVEHAWDAGVYEERLHEFYHLALHLGLDTTPAALICNELLIGSRPYGVLREAVQRCLITPQTLDADPADGSDAAG